MVGLGLPGCEGRTVSLIEVAQVEIVPDAPRLLAGDSLALSVILRDRNGGALPTRDVTWSSQDPSVANVGADGLVRGLREGTTSIQASVGSVQGAVPLTVEAPPTLEVEELTVTFESMNEGATSTRKEVEITSGGGRQLTGLMVDVTYPPGGSSGWLEAALSRTTTPAILEIEVSAEGLEPGSHRGELALHANEIADSPRLIQVEVEVREAPPSLSVSPSALVFQSEEGAAAPPPVAVRITDSRGGGVSGLEVQVGSGDEAPGWLAASLVDDTSPTDLIVNVDPAGLSTGVYEGVVSILGTEARNTPLAIPVRFLVGEPPSRIGLSPSRVSVTARERGVLGSISPLTLRNEGGRELTDLSVEVIGVGGSSAGWLTASLESTQAPTQVRLRVDQSDLAPGVYEAEVSVRAPDAENSPESSRVILTVVPVASPETSTLEVSPDVLPADGEATALVEVQLRDSRGDPMTGGGDEVVLSLEGGGSLAPVRDEGAGRYTSILTASTEPGATRITGRVNGQAMSQSATVEFEEGPPPPPSAGIELSPPRVEVSAPEGERLGPISSLTVRSDAGVELSDLSVEVVGVGGSSAGWLRGTLQSTRTPAEVRLSVDQRDLEPGVHEAEVRVRAPDAENSPQSSRVVLTVVPVASPETSTLDVTPDVLPADGEATALVEVQLRDSRGDPMTGGGDEVVLGLEGGGRLAPIRDEGGGRYTSTLTAPTEPGTTQITGRVNGEAMSQSATIEFEVEGSPPPRASRLIVAEVVTTGTGGPQGDRHLSGHVRVEDGEGDPVERATISARLQDGDTGLAWEFAGVTGSEGLFPFRVNNLPAGCYQLEVTELAFEDWTWDGSTPANEYCRD